MSGTEIPYSPAKTELGNGRFVESRTGTARDCIRVYLGQDYEDDTTPVLRIEIIRDGLISFESSGQLTSEEHNQLIEQLIVIRDRALAAGIFSASRSL